VHLRSHSLKLLSLSVQNFRALENINIKFNGTADVIVGPNAVGKTTILEAIRITKAILAPRIASEPQQTLIALGAVSPHLPQQINFAALARDPKIPLVISCKYQLSPSEIDTLDSLQSVLVNSLVQSGLGSPPDRLALVQFLSSPEGKIALTRAQTFVAANITPIRNSGTCTLQLTFDPASMNFSGVDNLSQLIVGAFEGRLPPYQTLFTYFPADRSMPTGDVSIQLGAPDVNAQLMSYNTHPQTKFQRLKTTIVNSHLLNAGNPSAILDDFKKISSHLLKDREILGLKIDTFGLVSVQVRDLTTNQTFDLDSMSSGEKGLFLMFLLIGRSVADGGIILIDEPELHLNPAVCKLLLPFLIDQYLKPQDLQAIICSHSPEILGVAFDRPDCALHHLQSPTVISPILAEDRAEVFDALRRLGTSASDALFSSGSVFVEGADDIEILEAGFSSLLNRYKVTQLEGRGNIEREIQTLQSAEQRREIDTLKCFIFDLDNAPTNLKSTSLVRVNQWKRRCIENFLISEKVIYEVLRDDGIARDKIQQRGATAALLKEIAMSQLADAAITNVYRRGAFSYFKSPSFKELLGKSPADAAGVVFDRVSELQQQIGGLNRPAWCAEFEKLCQEELELLLVRWEAEWTTLCDGKRFFRDLHSRFGVRVTLIKLKVRIMERLEHEKLDEWILIDSFLKDSLKQ
jgi:predicted ATPase